MKISRINFLTILLLFFGASAYALSPETKLKDEKQEERAMKLFLEVRCLVCNGQVIENSDSQFSFDMRALIRNKISQKKSDETIKLELIEEFGDDILVGEKYSKFVKILAALILIVPLILFFLM